MPLVEKIRHRQYNGRWSRWVKITNDPLRVIMRVQGYVSRGIDYEYVQVEDYSLAEITI